MFAMLERTDDRVTVIDTSDGVIDRISVQEYEKYRHMVRIYDRRSFGSALKIFPTLVKAHTLGKLLDDEIKQKIWEMLFELSGLSKKLVVPDTSTDMAVHIVYGRGIFLIHLASMWHCEHLVLVSENCIKKFIDTELPKRTDVTFHDFSFLAGTIEFTLMTHGLPVSEYVYEMDDYFNIVEKYEV